MNFLDRLKIIKQYWSLEKFYFRSLFKKDWPLYGLIFQVTNVCNSRCLMCFNWQIVNQAARELSLAEIEKFVGSIGTMPSLTLGGGEPFLRQDLPEICEIFCRLAGTRKIAIPTNCLLPETIISQAKKILTRCDIKLKIVMSLDGVGEVHDAIRGIEGNFEKFLETYRALRKLAEEDGRVQFSVNTTICNRNEETVMQIIDFVDSLPGIKYHTMETIRGSFDQSRVRAPELKKYQQLNDRVLSRSKTLANDQVNKLLYKYYHRLALRILREKKQSIPCRVSSFFPSIDACGNVYNCELLPSIGNLRDFDFDFKRLWSSDRARRQRQEIAAKKCHCTHYCYQFPNILMSPWHFIKAVFFDKD